MRCSVFTHPGGPLQPHDLWTAWNAEPSLLIPIVVTVILYGLGVHRVWQRAGVGRGITRRSWICFSGGILALLIALVSPLDALANVLFSAHMTQHLILMLLAAPLLVMSDFPLALLWGVPRPSAHSVGYHAHQSQALSRVWKVVSSPVAAWLLFAISMWFWHAPTLYEAALRDEGLHDVEHLAFLMTGMLFWWVLFRHTTQKHIHYGMAIPYLFTTVLHSGILGALMTFTSQPWYPYYADRVAPWGLTPLQDQQLAGLIMWLPGGTVLTLFTIGYFAAWLHMLEQRSVRSARRNDLVTRHELKD
jgi:putative membrane protein